MLASTPPRERSQVYGRYNAVAYLAGAVGVKSRDLALGTAIGVAPRAFAYTALGGSLGDLGSLEALAAVAVLVAMALIGALLARRDVARSRAARTAMPREA